MLWGVGCTEPSSFIMPLFLEHAWAWTKWYHQEEMRQKWPEFEDVESWLKSSGQSFATIRRSLQVDGFAVVENVIPKESLGLYLSIHDKLVDSGDFVSTPTDQAVAVTEPCF